MKDLMLNAISEEHRRLPGKFELAHYLDIPEGLGLEALRSDVENGAVQFKGVLETFEKMKPGRLASDGARYNIILTNNKEQGLAAIEYSQAIYNEIEGNEKFDLAGVDIGDGEECEEDEEFSNSCGFVEDPFYLPVISYAELGMGPYFLRDSSPLGSNCGEEQFVGWGKKNRPYWQTCTNESIVIVLQRFSSDYGEYESVIPQLKKFSTNKHVYLLVITNNGIDGGVFDTISKDDKEFCFNLQLALPAVKTEVEISQETCISYGKLLLNSIANNYGFKIAPGINQKDLLTNVLNLDGFPEKNPINKINNLIRFISMEKPDDEYILTASDFNFVSKNRNIKVQKKMPGETLFGLEDVKRQVDEIISVQKYTVLRLRKGLKANYHNTFLMVGPPGTAKTTIAKEMAQKMFQQGLLPGDKFVSISGAQLKAQYLGQTAHRVAALFQNYNAILIDEVYALMDDNGKTDSFGTEAIAQLLIEIEQHACDKLIIFAGYGGKEMHGKENRVSKFLDANPGIKSRITATISFGSYTPENMVGIIHTIAKNQGFTLTKDCDCELKEYFTERAKSASFGNGREARRLLEAATISAATRVANMKKKPGKKELTELIKEDVLAAIQRERENVELLDENGSRGRVGFVF